MLVRTVGLTLNRRLKTQPITLVRSPNHLTNNSSSYNSNINNYNYNNSFVSKIMSERLLMLSQQLRLYKAPGTSIFDQIEKQQNGGEDVGFVESVTPVDQRPRFKRAAVLVCLFEDNQNQNQNLRVILTRRSSTLSTHSGEISLPGGKADEGDANDEETATREAKEEIGLDPSLVNVVTVLEPFLSKHLLRVTPVIGILANKDKFDPVPNVGEVDEIFDAPLEMFIKNENRRSEEREWMGYKYLIHYFDFETEGKKYLIWGLTAGILIRAASVVYQRPPAFQEQYPEFKFPTFVNKDSVLP